MATPVCAKTFGDSLRYLSSATSGPLRNFTRPRCLTRHPHYTRGRVSGRAHFAQNPKGPHPALSHSFLVNPLSSGQPSHTVAKPAVVDEGGNEPKADKATDANNAGHDYHEDIAQSWMLPQRGHACPRRERPQKYPNEDTKNREHNAQALTQFNDQSHLNLTSAQLQTDPRNTVIPPVAASYLRFRAQTFVV